MAAGRQEQFGFKVSDIVLSHRNILSAILMPVAAIAIGLVFVSILLLITKVNPLDAFGALIHGSVGSLFALASSLRWSSPLILSGLAVVIGFKAGIFNAGIEGQLIAGGFVASWIGFTFHLPSGIHPIVALILGGLAGALWALGPALLKAYYDASEIVTTLMLNYVAMGLMDFLVREYYRDPLAAAFLMTVKIHPTAVLKPLLPVGNVSAIIFFSILIVPVVAYIFVVPN